MEMKKESGERRIERAKRILLVDDDDDVRDYLKEALEEEGYDVDSFTEGEEALQRLGETNPQLALVDLGLPGMDGFHLVEAIKRIAPGLAVIVVSGHSQADYVAAAEIAGADRFIAKPFLLDHLLSEVKSRLRKKEDQKRLMEETE